jgi:hypothetical protein
MRLTRVLPAVLTAVLAASVSSCALVPPPRCELGEIAALVSEDASADDVSDNGDFTQVDLLDAGTLTRCAGGYTVTEGDGSTNVEFAVVTGEDSFLESLTEQLDAAGYPAEQVSRAGTHTWIGESNQVQAKRLEDMLHSEQEGLGDPETGWVIVVSPGP